MRFTKYQINEIKHGDNTLIALKELNVEDSFHILNKSDVQEDTIGKFAISNCTYENNIIIGKLSQSYNIDLIKFDGTSKEEVPIKEDSANDNKTYFFINCSKAQIYIQNRRYSPEELSPNLTIKRIESILNKYLSKDYNVIVLQKVDVNYDIKEIENYFRESFVKSVEFHNVSDFKLAEGTKLHNPREDLDSAAVESWNQYSSGTVDKIKVIAKKDKSIAKNPIANIGIKLAEQYSQDYDKILKGITLMEEGQDYTIKPKGNEYLVVPVSESRNTTYTEMFGKILNYISKKKL